MLHVHGREGGAGPPGESMRRGRTPVARGPQSGPVGARLRQRQASCLVGGSLTARLGPASWPHSCPLPHTPSHTPTPTHRQPHAHTATPPHSRTAQPHVPTRTWCPVPGRFLTQTHQHHGYFIAPPPLPRPHPKKPHARAHTHLVSWARSQVLIFRWTTASVMPAVCAAPMRCPSWCASRLFMVITGSSSPHHWS